MAFIKAAAEIESLENSTEIPESWVAFIKAAADAGLIGQPGDVDKIGDAFTHVCLDYAITESLGMERNSAEDLRRALAEQDGVVVGAEQFDRLGPELDAMCEDLKAENVRPPLTEW